MLKARYFPNSDFLAALRGSLPSLTWQSLLLGRDLLRLGLRWHIGDGRLVNIYGDSWVPYDRVFTIQLIPNLPSTSQVCDLITASGRWDVGKIYDTFSFPEAEAILSIPLMGDTLVWEAFDFPSDFRLFNISDAGTWVDAAWTLIPSDKQSLFVFTVWVLWNERNGVLFGSQPPPPPGILVQCAKDYDDEFNGLLLSIIRVYLPRFVMLSGSLLRIGVYS
ncbi:hypothetical protein L3X38_017666 [Prunus dulcis]|uniref:Uncharacterized protein n=1 Tax=Prunus dulcis TaxID=3755 RepID=A0AAD4ZA01_PRUDU|nr:hypothetical protein L3X38_017666 [Prunus dulcis]